MATHVTSYGPGAGRVRQVGRLAAQLVGPIDLLMVVTDCHTGWPSDVPPFPVITIRVGDGLPPPWGDRGANKVITIEDRDQQIARSMAERRRQWRESR